MGTRTENVARNASFAFITQVINILVSFIDRTIFIYVLGAEYLGVNGLFKNVIMLLSFAELGIGNAIIYSMYKPLAIGDKERIKSLMAFYAQAYRIIGILVASAGLLLVPFLDYVIKDAPNIKESISLVYLLFLANTAVSYFFVYKRSIIIADQKNYIVSIYQQAFHIIQIVVQMIFLLLTRQYVLYLVIQIVCTLSNNIVLANKADKMYPYLRLGQAKPLDSAERQSIITNVKALFLYKLGSVMLNGTDNIIISALIGVVAVGLSSNYILIIAAFTVVSGHVMEAFTASVGNLNVVGDKAAKERVFDRMFFISAWLYGFLALGLYMFLNDFIDLWLGQAYLLADGVVFALVLHFYIKSVHITAYTYRTTMGLFVQGKLAPLMAAILNIVLSFVLAKPLGLMGIFLATSIARFFTLGLVDPILIYRVVFNKNPVRYYIKYFAYVFLFVGLYFVLNLVVSSIAMNGVAGFAVKVGIVTVLFNGLMVLIFYKSKDFQEIKNAMILIIRKRYNRIKPAS